VSGRNGKSGSDEIEHEEVPCYRRRRRGDKLAGEPDVSGRDPLAGEHYPHGGVNLDMIPPDGVGLKPCFCGGWIDVAEAV